MATYEIQDAAGNTYRVEAPDADTAYKKFMEATGGQKQPAPAAPASQPKSWAQWGKEQLFGDNDPSTLNAGETAGVLTNMGVEGLTLGLIGEEAGAALDEFMGRGTYEDRLKMYRDAEAKTWEDHPYLSAAANILPALIPGAGLASAASKTTGLGNSILRGMGLGAGAGATAGFMEGEGGFGNRVQNAAGAATIGAGIGGGSVVLGDLLRRGYRAGAEALNNSRLGAAAGKALGVNPKAARVLTQDVLALDDPAAMTAAMQKAGPDAMLADSGPMAQGALDAAIQAPGRAARTALTRIDDRATASAARTQNVLDQTMGVPQGVNTATTAIREGSAPARASAYDLAYSQPIDYSAPPGMALEGLLPRIPPEAIRLANRMMQMEGVKSPQILFQIGDDGAVAFKTMPDVRQWDYIKRALRQSASSGEGQGALGGQTDIGRIYQNLSGEVRGNLGKAVPDYGKAVDTAADAIEQVEGVKFGSKLLDQATKREDVAEFLKGASKAELAAVRQGLRTQIDEIIANVRAVASDPNVDARQAASLLANTSSKAARTKMKMLMGDAWPQIEKQLDEVTAAVGLRARVAANSRTFGRTAFNQAMDDALEPGALRQGRPVQAVRDTVADVTGASRKAINRLKAEARGDIADILTRQGQGPQTLQLLEMLANRYQTDPMAGTALATLLRTAGMGSIGTTAPPAATYLRGLLGSGPR